MPGAERLADLEKAAGAKPSERYRKAAKALSAARRKAAEKLDKAVNGELKPLKLERAQFSTEITSEADAPGRTASTASNSGCRPIPAPGRGR